MRILFVILMILLLAKYALGFLVFAFEASFRILALAILYFLFMGLMRYMFGDNRE